MTEEIRVSYSPQLGDVLRAARIAEGLMWKNLSRVVAIILALPGGWFVYWGYHGWATVWFALAAAEWFNLLPLSVLVACIQFKRNPKYRQRYTLVLSPEAMLFLTDTIRSELKWAHFTRFVETKQTFVLLSGAGLPTVIPKAAFSDDADRNRTRTLLETVVGATRGSDGAA